jgi:hypothetical protein
MSLLWLNAPGGKQPSLLILLVQNFLKKKYIETSSVVNEASARPRTHCAQKSGDLVAKAVKKTSTAKGTLKVKSIVDKAFINVSEGFYGPRWN